MRSVRSRRCCPRAGLVSNLASRVGTFEYPPRTRVGVYNVPTRSILDRGNRNAAESQEPRPYIGKVSVRLLKPTGASDSFEKVDERTCRESPTTYSRGPLTDSCRRFRWSRQYGKKPRGKKRRELARARQNTEPCLKRLGRSCL